MASPHKAELAPGRISASVWAPFMSRPFLWLWLANTVSALGTWIQNAASAWIMTDLAPSPLMVSLVQAAAQFPALLLALPAGALADLLDRKRYLIATNLLMFAAAAALAIVAASGSLDASILLGLTAVLAVASALNNPAWAASVPQLLPRHLLPQALVLNSIGFNLARAFGPAIGGVILAGSGAAIAFGANAASFVFVALISTFALTFPRPLTPAGVPSEPIRLAMRAGFAYAMAEPVVRTALVRSIAFFGCASAIWALLPLYVRDVLRLSSASFGLMMAAIGVGAVVGGFAMPALTRALSRDNLILLAGAVGSIVLIPLAVFPSEETAYAALTIFGVAWIAGAANLQATVQLATAPWVRARVLALYQAIVSGSMAIGALVWGGLGEQAGLGGTFFAAGLFGSAIALLTRAIQLPATIGDPSAAAKPLPRTLQVSDEMAPMLQSAQHRLILAISYHVDPSNALAFRAAMADVRLSRYRDGAASWTLSRDVSDPTHWVETFRMPDWHELQRGIERHNLADSQAVARARSYHLSSDPPRITLLLQEGVNLPLGTPHDGT